jgi:hypothetical protein
MQNQERCKKLHTTRVNYQSKISQCQCSQQGDEMNWLIAEASKEDG